MKSKIIQLFEKVQKIPYRVSAYDKTNINESLAFGDCRHKSELLKQLLEKEGFEVREIRAVFDWADLPIQKKILDILESGTKFYHRLLQVKINKKWIKVDCTWNLDLKKKGFPVTENWDGESDTKQITNGKLKFYEKEDFDKIKIKIDKEEALKFAKKLNKFLSQ